MTLANKTAVITGASRGIGATTARHFAKQGANVVLIARSAGQIQAIADEITAAGGKALALSCDVAAWEELRDAMTQAEAQFGPVDILIN
ncbi:MAG: SDR family NAD(P)-dependent oxidoreductase, partial [Pseudomonadota bacterium]|nr:SDR family NAD(P)-dependent oxidoreductase [Pseudomonadota bacterium]